MRGLALLAIAGATAFGCLVLRAQAPGVVLLGELDMDPYGQVPGCRFVRSVASFQIATNHFPLVARDAAEELADLHHTIGHELRVRWPQPERLTRLYLLDDREYDRLSARHAPQSRGAGGFFAGNESAPFDLIATWPERINILHEGTHAVLAGPAGKLSWWFTEAMALYTAHLALSRRPLLHQPASLGMVPLSDSRRWFPADRDWTGLLFSDAAHRPRPARLSDVTHFPVPQPEVSDPREERARYAWTVALLHYLLHGERGAWREDLGRYVGAILANVPPSSLLSVIAPERRAAFEQGFLLHVAREFGAGSHNRDGCSD